MPGIVYRFENQNILTFEEIMKFMGYLPLEINFDFETTCGKKTNNFAGDRWLYPISYSVIIAFHHHLVKYI